MAHAQPLRRLIATRPQPPWTVETQGNVLCLHGSRWLCFATASKWTCNPAGTTFVDWGFPPHAERMPKIAALLLLLLLAPVASSEEVEPEAAPCWTAKQRDAALKRAIGFLDDNLWKLGDFGGPYKQYAVAVAGWAYLLAAERGGKRLPSRAKQLHRIRDYLERDLETFERRYDYLDENGRWPLGKRPGVPDPSITPNAQFTWTLSMAALFFAESLARGEDKRRSRSMLHRIVAILERSQQPNGGWGHDDAHVPGLGVTGSTLPRLAGYPRTLLGATNCAASALGTAHRLLETPDPESVPLAIGYYREAQNADGSFPYTPGRKKPVRLPAEHGAPDSSVIARARTFGALFALCCLGAQPDEDPVPKAVEVVGPALEEASEGHGSATLALQFGALLSRAQGDERWKAFCAIYVPAILAEQDKDGSFGCVCLHEVSAVTCDGEPPGGLGATPGYRERAILKQRTYVTAIHCLILMLDRAPSRLAPPVPATKSPVTPR